MDDQSLCTRSSFEQICMNNIIYIYKHAGKCYDQQNIKEILDAAMVSSPEGVIDNSPNVPMTSTPAKKTSASTSLCLFTKTLEVKKETAKCCVVAKKSKRRAMKVGTSQWEKKDEKGIQI